MFFVASIFVKMSYRFIRIFGLGNGYTWPGHLILKIFPQIWHSPSLRFRKGVILISGTNGKTTTAKLLAHLLEQNGNVVTHNHSGANLVNGILTSTLLQTTLRGYIASDYAVFEVDELNLPAILSVMEPDYLVLTNLTRDQLDRCGETDMILEKWEEAFKKLRKTFLIMNSEFEDRYPFFDKYQNRILSFDNYCAYLGYTSLVGSFNALNVNAAVLVAQRLGLDSERIKKHLSSFAPAFGRGERITFHDYNFYVFLAKNPASLNNNLEMIRTESFSHEAVLFMLNDKIPDGRDVSWIYDVYPELLVKACAWKKVYVSGLRSVDMKIRLNYAGITSVEDLGKVSPSLLKKLPEKNVVVLPNYSAMLEFRKLVTGRNIL